MNTQHIALCSTVHRFDDIRRIGRIDKLIDVAVLPLFRQEEGVCTLCLRNLMFASQRIMVAQLRKRPRHMMVIGRCIRRTRSIKSLITQRKQNIEMVLDTVFRDNRHLGRAVGSRIGGTNGKLRQLEVLRTQTIIDCRRQVGCRMNRCTHRQRTVG